MSKTKLLITLWLNICIGSLVGGAFYWYEWKPENTRGYCLTEALNRYHAKEGYPEYKFKLFFDACMYYQGEAQYIHETN